MSRLSDDFLIELAKTCIVSGEILDVVKPHLNYSYLGADKASQPYKEIFKYIFDYHSATKKPPTIGLLSQNVNSRDCLVVIGKIRDTNVYGSKEQILEAFQEFLRRARFINLHKKVEEIYNAGKHDEAVQLMAQESKSILEFSLKTKLHSRIFANFDQRQHDRQTRDFSVLKVPTGIPQFDYHTRGGMDKGTGLLGIARSGVGKTTFLRSLGGSAAFRGINVLHIAGGDSTQQEIEDGYDSWWTGLKMHDVREGNFEKANFNKIESARQAWLGQCGEIFVHVFKQFHSCSIADCRMILMELLKEYDIGLVLFDLLESFEPGDGKRYGTNQDGISARKKATSEKIINVATEFNVAVAAVTQASDIKKEDWNNPNYVITRNQIANLKAAVDPFAYVVTLNQTMDEDDQEIMRIHEEKLRHYKVPSFNRTYQIAQKRDVGRFIDVAETKRRFWDDVNKKIIRNTPKA